jgi:voltage-dependent calcium channel T type alpha-1G
VEPENWRKHFYKLTHHPFFDKFIVTVVLLNTLAMAINSYQSSIANFLKVCNIVFTVIFNLEMILKLIAELGKYFLSGWNRLDFFIVVSADLGIALDFFSGGMENEWSGMIKRAITVFRVLRILRVAKLLQRFRNVQILLNSLI